MKTLTIQHHDGLDMIANFLSLSLLFLYSILVCYLSYLFHYRNFEKVLSDIIVTVHSVVFLCRLCIFIKVCLLLSLNLLLDQFPLGKDLNTCMCLMQVNMNGEWMDIVTDNGTKCYVVRSDFNFCSCL